MKHDLSIKREAGNATRYGARYLICDLTAKTETTADELSEALWRVDFLHKKLNHRIRMTNTQNGESFDWESV